jgi:uncharacterized protein
MSTQDNREKVTAAFENWKNGTGHFSDLLADDLVWTIVGNSVAAKTYHSKQEFVDEVLIPFNQRFATRFHPIKIQGIYADGDMVVVHWEGEGMTHSGKPYINTYAWFLRMRDGLVFEATAFFDSFAFNELWEVTPIE